MTPANFADAEPQGTPAAEFNSRRVARGIEARFMPRGATGEE